MPRTLWVARHGSRLDFDDPTWAPRAERPHDTPLSLRGRTEAEQIGRRLEGEPIEHVFSSPFLRAVETATPLAEFLGLSVKIEHGFAEWMNPAWFSSPPEPLSVDELARRFPLVDASYASRGRARYGESGEEALRRAGETALELVREFSGSFLIVGHGASVQGVAAGILGRPFREPVLEEVPFACLVKLVHDGALWRMELSGDTSHLSEARGGDRFA